MQPYIVCVSGGSGSGKTTFAKRLQSLLGDSQCSILAQDSYYKDQSNKFDHDGGSVNFDHPDAIEFSLMATHLGQLREPQTIKVPIYDFATHTRSSDSVEFFPKPIILVDGILVLSQKVIRDKCDYNIFISCEEKLRFERRLHRDVQERGRTEEGVRAQFLNQVKPMHDEFVESSKQFADEVAGVEDFDTKLKEVYLLLKEKI